MKKVYVKSGDIVKKGDLLAEIDPGEIENQIKLQEINLKKAQIVYNEKLKSEGNAVQNNKNGKQMAALDLEAERLKLNGLRSDYEKTKLYAPIDGTVDYVLSLNEGQFIDAYKTLIRIADTTNLQLQYSEDKIFSFQSGMKVEVTIGIKTYDGEVVRTPSDLPADADEDSKKSIRISVKNMPQDVKIGEKALITLRLDKKENAIVLPKNLIHNLGSRNFVQVLANGIREECDVELGLETDTEVEIVKGLAEGDKIIK
ncbi:efflux transporter, RND family, MFP subunit [Pseudobacteroides cellulosolvens ATCC 35603 = DSM 2933]|uniref:Efflux transporter, RND family, MFP subunit n=1 Tax=Pseudobacteroides cellulosolvens ATCC 35603 = DSM 2933 TaxID=398512 RepID=A0A0L6JJR0_9FIRM|nr:efflux transporter, RND family, MFP subunit [Pseudobacteroides cellulosolvens ATCC 35603 = DSM 2933]